MKTITKRMISLFTFFLVIALIPQNIKIANAATTGMVYKYSSMLVVDNNVFYIKSVEGDTNSYNIYKLDVNNGLKTKITTSDNYILTMVAFKGTLYYTSSETGISDYTIYSVSFDGGNKRAVCVGNVVYADKNGIYYTINKDEKCKLYRKGYDESKATLVYTGNSTLSFIKNLESTLYFSQYTEASSKVALLSMESSKSKMTTFATSNLIIDFAANTFPAISDVVKVNGDIYYQYGTYQGTGSYWYGTLVKVDSDTKKKSVITKDMIEDSIYHNATKIFYEQMGSIEKHNLYDTKSGKTSIYTCKVGGTETFNILGEKTYIAKPEASKYITVSCFTSGTNKKNLTKNLIKIPYKQKSNLTYTASVKQLGKYLLIPVECVDYSAGYGWRGKYMEINWYITDQNGKLLADIK